MVGISGWYVILIAYYSCCQFRDHNFSRGYVATFIFNLQVGLLQLWVFADDDKNRLKLGKDTCYVVGILGWYIFLILYYLCCQFRDHNFTRGLCGNFHFGFASWVVAIVGIC